MNDLILGVAAYKAIDHYVTSADARLNYKASKENIEYLKERDKETRMDMERRLSLSHSMSYNEHRFREEQNEQQRRFSSREAVLDRIHESEMQEREHEIRRDEIDAQYAAMRSQESIAKLHAYNANLDREVKLKIHAAELDQQERLEIRRLRVQENIARQQKELQEYLYAKGVKDSREIEKFKALAERETQILIARENAQNILQDVLVKQALSDFPLNISPIVLLRNRPHSLTGLLRFSSLSTSDTMPPSVVTVYEDVRKYSANPEAINIFIAPISVSYNIENRDNVRVHLWDSMFQRVESFFTKNYNRNGSNPVILYPTAWRNGVDAGQHASETLHFFLKDMPCVVIEPRFDGHFLKVMISSWNIGYISNDHTRSEMVFDANLDVIMINAAYERSKKTITILEKIKDLTPELQKKKEASLRNIKYYEQLDVKDRISNKTLDEIEALGTYKLFDIDPLKDTEEVAETLSSLIILNLAIISDAHHLHATDTLPIFPTIFKSNFPDLFANKELRQLTFQCYERVLLLLRSQDSMSAGANNRREIERLREIQITNLQKDLELIDESSLMGSLEEKVRKYAKDILNLTDDNMEDLWGNIVDKMRFEDIPFFKEILPNITNRRLYKSIDKKIAELQR